MAKGYDSLNDTFNTDDSVESEIMYVKYDSEKLSYIYICKHCNQKWKNRENLKLFN